MEIQVNKLTEVLDLLKPVVPREHTIKAPTHILLEDGRAIAGDSDVTIVATLKEADEPILLPFTMVAKLVAYVPGHEVIKITRNDRGQVILSWSAGTGAYDSLNPSEYPGVPRLEDPTQGKLDGDSLIPALLSVLPFVSKDDTRPVLQGVCLVLGNTVQVAAADGFRLAYNVLPLSFPVERTIILPAAAVSVLGHLLNKTPRQPGPADSLVAAITAKRQLDIGLTDSLLRVGFGTVTAIIRLIQGSFPDYLRLIPTEEPTLKVQLFGPELESAIRRVSQVARDGTGAIRMVFEDSKATISSKSESGEIQATISAMNTQGAGRLAVNFAYLLSYVKGKDGIITLSKTTDTGPILLQYQQTPTVLIMPMRVDWPGDKKEEPAPAEPAEEPVAEAPESPAETTAEATAPESALVKPRRGSRRKAPTETSG